MIGSDVADVSGAASAGNVERIASICAANAVTVGVSTIARSKRSTP